MNRNDHHQHGRYSKVSSTLVLVLVFVLAMSLFAYVRLSTNDVVFTAAIVILIILGVTQIILGYKGSTRLDVAYDATFLVVLMSVILGVYRTSLAKHPVFMFATIFFRPEYTRYGNRRFAFVVGLLINATVLPITCGVITDPDVVSALTLLYALFVLSLWVFCSKRGCPIHS